jgi:putative addiction module component (TIGR02574 family)
MHKTDTLRGMSMTVDQIVAEARQLPREQKSELFDWLLAESFAQPDSEIDAAWRVETRRRIEEIQSDKVKGIPGEQVMGELRKIVGL